MNYAKTIIEQIDAVLPQTQCTLCHYSGCQPYAEAIVNNNESIDRCLPGGVKTLLQIANITGQDATPYIDTLEKKTKSPMVAMIRESECIGCTKCIQACPVDAIIGATKQMHTVINDICTGCELCVTPCPTDCIDMLIVPELNEQEKIFKAQQAKQRFIAHTLRSKEKKSQQNNQQTLKLLQRKAEIQAAVLRVRNKRKIKSP
jgi:electron transport complex protein RnfB